METKVHKLSIRECYDQGRMDAAYGYKDETLRRSLSAPQRAAYDRGNVPAMNLSPDEVSAVLARLADLWRGSDEAPAVRSAAGDFQKAFQAKSPAFDGEAFWRACRIDLEDTDLAQRRYVEMLPHTEGPVCRKRCSLCDDFPGGQCPACAVLEEPAPCPAPGHLDPADPRPGVTVTADCGWCGEPVRVR